MLDNKLKQQLKSYLANLRHPVHLQLNLNDSNKAAELSSLADDIASISPNISAEQQQSADRRAPLLELSSAEHNGIAFAGVPMSHEFTSLVLALLQTGGHPVKADEALQQQIRNLPGEYNFEVYVSLSCQTCPDVVQALNAMASLNPNIRTTMIDGGLFPDEVEQRQILAVPTVFLNGEQFSQGRLSLADIVAKLDTSTDERIASEINEKDPYDLLVVGAGPAGAAAAIYAARKGIRTGLVADRFGGQVQDTLAIENFISVKATEGPKLVANLEQHVLDYDVDVMTRQQASALHNATEPGQLHEIELASGAGLQSKTVLIATGARWREMNVPGEQEYRGRGVAYCPHCDGPLFKGKSVAVIGGGNSGIEAAIDLAGIVEHVTVLEFDHQLRADAVLQKKADSLPNVTIITQAQTTEVLGDGNKVTGLRYTDRASGDSHDLALAGIFVQIGLVPNSDWLKGSLELTDRGEVVVDARNQTSASGVFAAGDVTTAPYKQIIIAMGSGANAALAAFDHLIRQ